MPGCEKDKDAKILDVVREITDLLPDDNEMLQSLKPRLMEDAALLSVIVGGAMTGELYDIKMEAATLIRRSAHDLIVSYHSIKDYSFREVEYYLIVRNLIEEYRLLFTDWVAGFDKWNYIVEEGVREESLILLF